MRIFRNALALTALAILPLAGTTATATAHPLSPGPSYGVANASYGVPGTSSSGASSYGVLGEVDALPTCALSSLPREASHTLELIHSGGPFPYDRDGTVFQNREGLLPSATSGYYREYTVKTPGSPDRGARRLVGGGRATSPAYVYYTSDHYASFCEVDEQA
ncbi:ribonuclease domain-containing protein [Kribbella deserti]|uniref:Ribonuclease domain-containing protein n=1 Tax=Kribbella deserti TaxID=1926257 RepID=A0ABV6QW51_9ACTN